MGLAFQTLSVEVDETHDSGESAEAFVMRLAEEKALKGAELVQNAEDAWVIGGDTLVIIGEKILGKPESADAAGVMLNQLSGSVHQVYSAVALFNNGKVETLLNKTEVEFEQLSDFDIDGYIASGEPFGKAGAYAIQGQAAKWIKRINGSYYAVMGLPVYELEQLLKKMNFYKN